MAISDDKCLSCGTRYRPGNLDTSISPSEGLDSDGTFLGLPYWFCSVDCYKKAVGKHIKDKRYGFDRTPQDDEGCQAAVKDAYAELMTEMRGGLISNFFKPKLRMSESEFIQAHVKPTVDRFYGLQSDEIFAAEMELHQRLHAEWMHQIDEDNEAREAETAKRHEQLQRAWDKYKQQEAKEEAERAEEERWQPKPFRL